MERPVCRDCREPMEEGFLVDHAHGARLNVRWAHGRSGKASFLKDEVTWEQADGALRVRSFRCPKCGLLDSYALGKD